MSLTSIEILQTFHVEQYREEGWYSYTAMTLKP